MWNRVRKISGRNVCPPKQYLNGKDGAPITDFNDIANKHAAAFTDNSSSAHYSVRFQTIKAQDERARIDFTSDNTEVYNKRFRLRDLRRSISKAKPCAPGPDGIHNNLLKHLPGDTLKILKEILNIIWISGDFPPQWRAATVIPIPKPNKDHTNPLSYRPIALTSCLCKVLERYSHQSGTELLPTHGPSPLRCSGLLWLNVLFASNWGWRHREPFYLPYHEPALVIEWQGHTCSFLLVTKPLWHWRKWKSGPTSKRDPRPRYRPTGKCSLYRYETTGQLLHSKVGSNQVGCSCTWQRSLSCETNTGATKEIPAPNQSWRGCNHRTSNWPYQGHQVPYLVPRSANWLSPLWPNIDHWPYTPGVCIVTGMSWWILHSRLIECSLQDNSWDLHSGIPVRSGILLSHMI